MKVLLTGATGLLGGHVARGLVEAGHGVRVLVRAQSSLANLDGLDLERAEGDVTDRASLDRAMQGRDALVHTAGVASWSPLDTAKIRAVNVDGVRHAVEAAAAAGVRRIVVTSSVAAVGGGKRPVELTEASPWELGPLDIPYVSAKRAGEQEALRLGRERSLEVVVVNPGFLTGPGDIYGSSSSIVLAVVKGKMGAYVEGGATFADVRDVAQAHVAALERGRAGERYILGGENLTMTAFMALVAKVAGVKVPKRVPLFVAAIAARVADARAKITKRPQPLSTNLLKASSLYTFCSSAKAASELGYQSRPLEESLRDTLRYFLGAGRLKPTTPELVALAAKA